MKIIFDNIIFYLQKSGGGTIYWLELIKRAIIDDSIEEYFSEPSEKLNNHFRFNIPLKVTFHEKFPILWLRISNFSIHIKGKFIFHSSYYRISKSKEAINIVTIHDFTSEFYLKGVRRLIHMLRKKNAIYNAQGIICISNNTKNDLLKLYPGIDEKRIRVIYNGVSEEYYTIPKSIDISDFKYISILKEKYILYVGHRTSYKNFMIAAETVASLDISFKFVVIGEKLTNAEIRKLDELLNNRYICLSGIENKCLNLFYNYAFCLIYPSSYEGFGIPILEAMKAGCPVVTTDKSSIPEVAGDAAIMVSDISSSNFRDAIEYLSNIEARLSLIEKGYKQAEKFSWDKSFNEVHNFYQKLYDSKQI